jgi:GGDEF domain-containing protein
MNRIKQLLLKQLRKGDTITCWNYRQFAVLLPGVNEELTEKVLKRIINPEKEDTKIIINQVDKLPSLESKTS